MQNNIYYEKIILAELIDRKCIRLKELRLEMNYTQKQLAQNMEISLYRLKCLENLSHSPNILELARLAYWLDAKSNYITGESFLRRFPENLPYAEYEEYDLTHGQKK